MYNHDVQPEYLPIVQVYDAAERPLSILPMLVWVSNGPCTLVPWAFGDLLLADRDAASIWLFVCWCMVRAYDESVNSPLMSYPEGDEEVLWPLGMYVDADGEDIMMFVREEGCESCNVFDGFIEMMDSVAMKRSR